MLHKLAVGLGLGAATAAIVLAVAASGDLLNRYELTTYDWRMRLAEDPSGVNKNIVLVEINDLSIRKLEPVFGRWPWPRLAISFAIDFIRRAGAKAVAVDVLFSEKDEHVKQYVWDDPNDLWSGAQSDRALTDSVRKSGNVVMLADAVYEDKRSDEEASNWRGSSFDAHEIAEPRPTVLAPYQALADAAAALGHNFLVIDEDGPARRMSPFIMSEGKQLPSLGVAAALIGGGFRPQDVSAEPGMLRIGDRHIPLMKRSINGHDQWSILLNFRAPALVKTPSGYDSPYPAYEFRDVYGSEQALLMKQKPYLDPLVFRDKIVFIGLTASGLLDVFRTPVSTVDSGSMPGIQLHASMADSILANRFITPPSTKSRLASVFIIALGIGLLSTFLPFTRALPASLVILGGLTWFSVMAFRDGRWLNLVQPLAAGALTLFFGTAYQYFVEGREKRKVSRLFGRYVSKDVYAQLMANPEQATLGGNRRDMSVLFSDIRGFTTVTEKGEPEALVHQLNEYFTRMVDVVFRHGGTVDKFVGDMVMALFGAPLDDPHHAEHAVATAVDMIHELGELNRAWAAKGLKQLDIGIGVNSGDMIAGNIGSSSIMSYTVIGDNVNLGSRLESLNKDYKTRIIISDATRTRLESQYEMRPLGDVIVKGKSKPVAIFEVKVPAPLIEVQTT